ncbi:hypothetical protein SERLA73DRAFT_135885 [Serpula lacrymans var. lacrymans S7.3]|uniref:Uncharacterized protein n=2 Tax=Serpula lacrymans var. lacrymans TaxID=341189 RepID=F8PVQ1_SERL3|nr:uncharacterized protein SERLADRAFT_388149 [Serpula lacrymans var. lacrymans S7.9]EGO00185.1 hypothetical protein SERLA73DRAFT_135885 [Serpula lacrymans var. lacrymans S7.3]EGO25742.1 hypothetical protein SERLADRAFT_388149 [Serpula lacrymans var. lacrymans S7.9]
MPQTTVYHYIDNRGEQVASLLPSDHPEMICLLGGHVPEARYGMLGERTAFLLPPEWRTHIITT